ncbi:uncharacterized protein PRCAT00002143001 [Priceomyces carsonii]|uniref:uncharacterized protein n=1 Tax=Priceomyces carsonii TaxID=28549 RepID=UPI002ED87C48|nr:unnamed protein product [Priceomyces carsonii]
MTGEGKASQVQLDLNEPLSSKGKTKKSFKINWKWLSGILVMCTYDLVLWFFDIVIHTFFRDIRSRGSFNIPRKGPVIFVIAPHHNQFVDPLVVMSQVKEQSGRRIAFLIAATSYRRKFIGTMALMTGVIPVERAQDLLKPATGEMFVKDLENEPLIVEGKGTCFTKECVPKGLIGFSFGSAQIESVESDSKIILKKPFKVNLKSPTARDIKLKKILNSGTKFKTAPHVDNNEVFQHVFNHLNSGKVLGIFPEGGSHDRTELLPLKPGVAIMALGAAAQSKDPNVAIQIIPVGMNYFHPDKFRSRVVIEFGKPIVVGKALAEKYKENSKDSVSKLLETIILGLKEVTVTCRDYDTLMAVQAARRLYTSANRQSIPLPLVVEMNRRLVKGYEKYSDNPEAKEIKKLVGDYNKKLIRMGLHDHQVPTLSKSNRFKTFIMFSERLFKVFFFLGLSMPGIILFSPVFITAKRISKRKAKEALAKSQVKLKANDVLGSWKIIVALGLAPALYITYSIIETVLIVKLKILPESFSKVFIFMLCYLWSVLTTYASLRIGEIGVDYYKSLKPLFYSLVSLHKDILQIEELKKNREFLAKKVTNLCNKYGPDLFDDYDSFYKQYNHLDTLEDYSISRSPSEESLGVKSVTSNALEFNIEDLSDVPIFSNILDVLSPPSKSDSSNSDDNSSEEDSDADTDPLDDSENVDDTTSQNIRLRKSLKKRLAKDPKNV